MNDYEISKLKKQLLRKNDVIKEMKNDLAYAQKEYITVKAQRDQYHGQLQIARHTLQNVDQIIDQKVKDMKTKLQHQNQNSLNELRTIREKLMEEKNLNLKYEQEVRNKDAVIAQLSLKIRELSTKYKDNSIQINVKQISEQASITHNHFIKLTEKYNRLSADMENILAQNKILRKLHGVPDNFGFDLEEIKIAEKQELQDYKAQCRKLETEIEELEAERTQLRYRLRQYHTLYSNKGDRYKDLTQRQLQLLDAYVIILKEGGNQFPEIDKTQKQMERQIIRLRAQVQILQNRNPMALMPNTKQEGNNQMNKDAMKKFQDQIKSILQPFVQDIRKLSQTNINTIIQNFQTIQGDTINTQINPGAISGLKPPIPLPLANNDWSKIKEGYSYRYACKIPVDLKDYDGQIGFDVIKAKYQIAALQLQNIESLKMLKEKQDQQKLIRAELTDLKQKFRKCLQVQDDLFIRFFKARDQFKEKSRQTQIDKRRATDERDSLRSEVNVLSQTLHVLSTKTDTQGKLKQFGQRLAKSEAGVVKSERKYQILFQQHKYLKDSYTKMELKAAQNQIHLKKKYLTAKANEKQLTFLTNQILDQTKDSVSSDTHNLLLSKMQTLNDKSANLAFKEMDLRMKISRLESIERQMNIKDEVIENLREGMLDILLQLEIVKSRLRATDTGYRQAFAVFDRLVGFINQNNISLMECFKKFDRDKSGTLTKSELKAALDAFGFRLNNQQYDLLYNEFDLDGSGSINYAEFMRKLKRGGAIARTPDQQAIYLFFRAIKSSNISIKKAFQIVDKDGSNCISKSEMQTAFRQIGIDCDSKTIDAIFRIADSDNDGSIKCTQLQSLYTDIIKQTEIDQAEIKPTLDWKYKFVIKVEEASIKNKMTLQEAFKSLDNDGNSYMTINELSQFLTKLGVRLETNNLQNLFNFLDIRRDGRVEFGEFLKLLDDAKKQERRVQRLLAVQRRAAELKKQNSVNSQQNQSSSSKPSEETVLKIKMMSFETKQANLIKKNEKLCVSVAKKQEQIKDLQKTISQNEKQIEKLQDMRTKQKEQNIKLQEKMKNYIGQFQSKKLKQESQKTKIQNKQLQTQLETFKGLCFSLTDKNKMELMSVQKIKAELNKHYDIVKQLQAENVNKSQLGRLALELEYSKRNEEIVNKKYEDICDQVKALAKENNDYSNQSLEKQKQIVNAHLYMRQKTNLMQKTIDSLTSKILPTVIISKIDDVISKLRQISSSKSQLQEQNKILRERNFNLQLKYDHIEIQRANLTDLQNKLRRNYPDQNSIALINVTKQLSDYKISELRVKRQYGLLKEKQQYYMRINNANTDSIKELEEQLGKWEIKFNQREEFWRKRMADQMKLVDEVQKQVQKTKQMDVKAQKYFGQKRVEEDNLDNKYNQLSQERQRQISMVVKPPGVYRALSSNNQRIQQLQGQVNELTQLLQDKEFEMNKLKIALQELVPQQKLRFSSIGSQIGSHIQTNSLLLQTDLTTSQLKSNARRFISNQREQETFLKQQADKMAQAAQHSIDTLQRIIDDKNDQIKRKDKMIDQLKREMLRNKNQDCEQIQKLNEQIRQLRSKTQMTNINQLMNKSTHKQFYPASNNDQRVKNLMQMIDEKDADIKNWEKKYNELYINKIKAKPAADNTLNNKAMQAKLKQLMEEREEDRKRYVEAENKLKQKIVNLEKLNKEKDGKLANLQKTLMQLKEDIMNQKKELNEEQSKGNEQIIASMLRGTGKNDSKMQVMFQKSIEKNQQLTKKLKDAESEIKRLKDESKLSRTMNMGRR